MKTFEWIKNAEKRYVPLGAGVDRKSLDLCIESGVPSLIVCENSEDVLCTAGEASRLIKGSSVHVRMHRQRARVVLDGKEVFKSVSYRYLERLRQDPYPIHNAELVVFKLFDVLENKLCDESINAIFKQCNFVLYGIRPWGEEVVDDR